MRNVILIDPGKTSEFSAAGSCDASKTPGSIPVSPTLDKWLALNPNNRLMVIAADETRADRGTGLTNYYLKTIVQNGRGSQITVCWYNLSHQAAYDRFGVNSATSLYSHPTSTCPAGNYA